MMTDAPNLLWPVILSGGSGTRLWPLSRSAMPKQLLPRAGPDTMIVTTAARTGNAAAFHAPIVVTGRAHAAIIREQLGDDAAIIVEPAARNTAPAIALAMLAVEAQDQDGVLLVMPSDHQIAAPGVLLAAVAAAVPAAQDGWLVTFGIRAATPETGYGYIRAGDPIGGGVHQALAVIEKPDHARARALVADGGYSWNAGIFLFSVRAMRAALAAHAPDVLAAAEAAMATAKTMPGRCDPDAIAFAAAPSISIDHAVFEHAGKVAVAPIDPGWSDIGSWDALHGLGVGDAAGNVVSGRVESIDANGCLLRADGVVLAAIGVANLNIVATPDAVLVTARGRSQEVRDITARLAGDPVLSRPVLRQRPWGVETLVHDGDIRVMKASLAGGGVLAVGDGATATLLAGAAAAGGAALVPGVPAQGPLAVTGDGAVVLVVGWYRAGPAPV